MGGHTVAIIGAGFSGTTAAIHLLRDEPAALDRLYLVERGDHDVGGVAYRTPSASHTLNVPAGRMSAFQEDENDFVRYVRRREPALTGGSFVPRKLYGRYLADTLEEARRLSRVTLIRVAGEAVGLAESADAVTLELADGRVVSVDQAVLAIGNYPPSDPPVGDGAFFSSIRYARDPWARDALELGRDEDVLLVGTGLTMCDIALALRDADHRGKIYAISRRGLLPQPHRRSPKAPPHLERPTTIDEWPDTTVGMLRALRLEVARQAGAGVDWREVVTSIRADTPALWGRLGGEERARFLRHARPYWETHRHRSSPETALGVEELIEEGRLEVIAGRLESFTEDEDGFLVGLRRRGGGAQEVRVGKVINCTGPDTDLARVRDPLVAALRRAGLIRPDELGLGLDSDDDGRLLAADGRVSSRLSLLGPLRKGRLWENTAVPELRVEARSLARRLAAELAEG